MKFTSALLLTLNTAMLLFCGALAAHGQTVVTDTGTTVVTGTTNPVAAATPQSNMDLLLQLEQMIARIAQPVQTFIGAKTTNGITVTQATNYFTDVYVSLPTKGFVGKGTFSNFGGGAVFGFMSSPNVSMFIGLDYFSGQLWMPTGNFSIHSTIQPFSFLKSTWTYPMIIGVFAGSGPCIISSGTQSTTLAAITGEYIKFNLGSMNISGKVVPFRTGLAYAQWQNAGSHTGNYVYLYLGAMF